MSASSNISKALVDACQILSAQGLGDLTRGHVSVRKPEAPERFLMKPHTFGFDEVTVDNLVECDLDGERLSGGPRHSEVYIHSEVYRARPDINSVIHVHPEHAVAFSATRKALLPLSQPAAYFADGVPYFEATIDLIRSSGSGRAVAEALGRSKALLMRNHGIVIAGASIAEAVILTLALESACRIQLLCEASGGPGEMFSKDDVVSLRDKLMKVEQHEINFDYLRRRHARRLEPGRSRQTTGT